MQPSQAASIFAIPRAPVQLARLDVVAVVAVVAGAVCLSLVDALLASLVRKHALHYCDAAAATFTVLLVGLVLERQRRQGAWTLLARSLAGAVVVDVALMFDMYLPQGPRLWLHWQQHALIVALIGAPVAVVVCVWLYRSLPSWTRPLRGLPRNWQVSLAALALLWAIPFVGEPVLIVDDWLSALSSS
jgi:hypothetical protein